jgi:hypothetical protein
MVRDHEPYSLDGIVREAEAVKAAGKACSPVYNKENEAYTCGTG